MGDPDYHVLVEGPRESDIQQAETLYKIAERELGEVIDFRFVYSDPLQRDSKFSLDIWHTGDYGACEDNLAYAAMVHKLLDTEVEIELSHAKYWNDIPKEIYNDTPRGRHWPRVETQRKSVTRGCSSAASSRYIAETMMTMKGQQHR